MTELLETEDKSPRKRGRPKKEVEENPLPLDPDENESLPKWQDGVPWRQQRQVLNRARRLYYREYSYERIFLLTYLPPAIYLSFRPKWEKGRKKIDEQILTKIRNQKVSDKADEFVAKGLQIGLKFLDRCIKRETELDAKDFKLITDAVMAIHRVAQLEKGQPTDIHAYETMSPDELSRFLVETRESLFKKHGDILIETKSYLPPPEAERVVFDVQAEPLPLVIEPVEWKGDAKA